LFKVFGKDMEKEIAGEQGGDLGRVFRSIASGNRDDSFDLDLALAKKEAQELYDVSEMRSAYQANPTRNLEIPIIYRQARARWARTS